MAAFELLQLTHHLIEIEIRDDGLIQNVVPVFVFTDLLPQILDVFGDGLFQFV